MLRKICKPFISVFQVSLILGRWTGSRRDLGSSALDLAAVLGAGVIVGVSEVAFLKLD
jgi:hypothetical protein